MLGKLIGYPLYPQPCTRPPSRYFAAELTADIQGGMSHPEVGLTGETTLLSSRLHWWENG